MKRTGYSIVLLGILGALLLIAPALWAQELGFTQGDRERLVRLEAILETFMHQVDKRLEQVDKRMEQVDKRIDELREDTNKRFQELREDTSNRFEQVDRRFEQLMTFLWMIVGIFTAMTVAVIGFGYWDRRTHIRKARDEAMTAIEKEGRLKDLIMALREAASNHPDLASSLRKYGLL